MREMPDSEVNVTIIDTICTNTFNAAETDDDEFNIQGNDVRINIGLIVIARCRYFCKKIARAKCFKSLSSRGMDVTRSWATAKKRTGTHHRYVTYSQSSCDFTTLLNRMAMNDNHQRHRGELKFPIGDEGKGRNLLQILEHSSLHFSDCPS